MNTTSNISMPGNGTYVSGNGTSKYFFPKLKPPFLGITFFLIVAIGVAGIVGNSFIFFLEYKQRQMKKGQTRRPMERSMSRYFIRSLAISDLLSCLIHTPLGVFWLYNDSIQSDMECKLHRIAIMSLSAITILNVTFISIERFLAVFLPFRAPSVTVSKTCVLLAWVFGFVFGILHVVPYKSQRFEIGPFLYTFKCVSSPPKGIISSLLVGVHTIVMYVVPNAIICISSICISRFLRKRKRKIASGEKNSTQRSSTWRIKDTAMFVKIAFAFYVPYTAFFVVNVLKEIGVIKVNFLIENIVQWTTFILAFSNSLINPIIYLTSSNDFRKVARKILARGTRQRVRPFDSIGNNKGLTDETGKSSVLFSRTNVNRLQNTSHT